MVVLKTAIRLVFGTEKLLHSVGLQTTIYAAIAGGQAV